MCSLRNVACRNEDLEMVEYLPLWEGATVHHCVEVVTGRVHGTATSRTVLSLV